MHMAPLQAMQLGNFQHHLLGLKLRLARIRRQSPGMMVAQSMINGLAVSMQRKRFGDAPPDPSLDPSLDR